MGQRRGVPAQRDRACRALHGDEQGDGERGGGREAVAERAREAARGERREPHDERDGAGEAPAPARGAAERARLRLAEVGGDVCRNEAVGHAPQRTPRRRAALGLGAPREALHGLRARAAAEQHAVQRLRELPGARRAP